MYSGSSAAVRPGFNFGGERPSSSRGRLDQSYPTSSTVSPRESVNNRTRAGTRDFLQLDATLVIKGGKKHHAFDPKIAPYPMNYDGKVLDADILDHLYLKKAQKSVSWVDFKDKPPTRSLDLGCGSGVWILDAARAWKDCHFVGFDLVRIQPNRHLLPPEMANRIQWVQGNFLTGRLPFDDDYFDHVHIYNVAWGVQEMQWGGFFEEVARVLRPGGAIEVAQEDILFPVLPRSYTLHMREQRPSAPYPRPSLTLSPPPSPLDKPTIAPHAHALIESLFFGVFEARLINVRPTAIIPHHLNIYFRQVLSTPAIECQFPPPPISRQRLRHSLSDQTVRSTPQQSNCSQPVTSATLIHEGQRQQETPPTSNLASQISLSDSIGFTQLSVEASQPVALRWTETSNNAQAPPVELQANDGTLALQLNVIYHRVLACKEAMWDELRRRVLLRRSGGQDLLQALGWDETEDKEGENDSSDLAHGDGVGLGIGLGTVHGDVPARTEAQELEKAREKFEELLLRFEEDLRHRTALTDVVETTLGWPKPPPPPKSKFERAREAELERAIAEAEREEAEQGPQPPQYSRSFKYFMGFKEGSKR